MSDMNWIPLETQKLLRYHSDCHGNIVTIVTDYVADAYNPKEALLRHPCDCHGNIVTE